MSPKLRRLVVAAPLLFVVLAIVGALANYYDNRDGPSVKPLPSAPLRELGRAHDITLGTAVDDTPLRRESGYRKDLARQFAALTPENAMKWDALEPERGSLRWAAADRAVAFATAHDMAVRGHTLVWHAQLPGWIADGRLGAAELRKVMRDHIATVMGRYKGRVRTWDVVNEVVGDDGALRKSVWLDTLGPAFIAEAFAAARRADPKARLAINEIGAEGIGPKSETLYRLAKGLKARGLLDEVGFQSHFTLDGVPPTMRKNLGRFAALGLDIAITEADVRVRDAGTPEQLDVQGQVYADLVGTCRAVARCRSLTVWGFTDRHSWIPESSPGYGSATLLDRNLQSKPAYRAFAAALRRG
ncbi:MAG: 1,4-beta-xylanase [Solirubrobacterales bacterium]|jgi:endo-1,4-beta-xylanase|nr:1,4-beta-xylanase [Solirubrobacterales bacterium]